MKKRALIIFLLIFILLNILLLTFLFKKRISNNLISPKTQLLGVSHISLLDKKPSDTGNPFEFPVMQADGRTALYVLQGRLQDIAQNRDGYSLAFISDKGTIVYEVVTVPKDFKARIIFENNKAVQREIPISEVKKEDSLRISFNIDTKLNKVEIGNIDVSRYE